MLKCANCGFENEPQALFCGNCGKPLGADVPTPPDGGDTTGDGDEPRPVPINGDGGPGTEDPDGPDEPAEETITCPHCQTVNPVARVFCSFCAKKLRPDEGTNGGGDGGDDDNGDDGRWRKVAIGLGVVAGIAAIAIIGLLVLNGGDGPKATASPPSTSPPTVGPTASASTSTPGPTFSEGEPSGRIAFSRCPAGGPCVVYMVNADGNGLTPLTIGDSATDPSFSRDGTRLVYVLGDGLWVRDLEAPEPTKLANTARGDVSPVWSSDGRQIAFAGRRQADPQSNDDREIRLDTLGDSNRPVRLTNNELDDHDPVFTPDGKYLFWVRGTENNRELLSIELETEITTRVTRDNFNDVDPAISPDGTKLVFVSNRDSTDATFDLWMLDLRNLSLPPTRVAAIPGNQHDPEWSPGGRYIVFHGDFDGSQDLFILDIEGNGEPVRITSTGDNDQWPSWAPIP